jgi:hypothetical protein
MVGFKGRDSMKQYLRSKPTRWGYKVWCLACDGYLLSFDVFKGKQQRQSDNASLHDTVLNLVRSYANRGHILYLDNLFPSPTLFDDLQHMGIRACGTLRPNRKGLPSDLQRVGKQLPKGGVATWQRGELGCLAWHDRQVVYLLSNHTDIDATVSFDQARGDGTEVSVIKPKVVHDYNLHRGMVDTVDPTTRQLRIGEEEHEELALPGVVDDRHVHRQRLPSIYRADTQSTLTARLPHPAHAPARSSLSSPTRW